MRHAEGRRIPYLQVSGLILGDLVLRLETVGLEGAAGCRCGCRVEWGGIGKAEMLWSKLLSCLGFVFLFASLY